MGQLSDGTNVMGEVISYRCSNFALATQPRSHKDVFSIWTQWLLYYTNALSNCSVPPPTNIVQNLKIERFARGNEIYVVQLYDHLFTY